MLGNKAKAIILSSLLALAGMMPLYANADCALVSTKDGSPLPIKAVDDDTPRIAKYFRMMMPGDKFARWEHACAFFGGTSLCIPLFNSHVLVEQCVGFPDVEYDDIVDALGVAARYCQIVKAKPVGEINQRLPCSINPSFIPSFRLPLFNESNNYRRFWIGWK